ncbi:chaplin family protein [Streptomyces sp. NPDC057136]|uniref:chaplin n=1 Tax=Streptomyces sp. NPDC057136 TaxID=3346029 RepID=UPI00362A5452
MIVMAAASGILSAAGGYAHADASADGSAVGSPGVGSGNAVQVPVHVPVNVCGNTVDVIALLNPAFGNTCANVDSGDGASQSGASAEGAATNSPGVLSGNLIQAPVHVPVNACGNSVDVVGALNPAAGNNCANVNGPDLQPPTEEPPTPSDNPPVEVPPVYQPPVEPPVDPSVEPPVGPSVEPPVGPSVEPPVGPSVEPPVDPSANESPASSPSAEQSLVDHGPHGAGSQLAETGSAGLGLAAGASAVLMLGGAVLLRRARGSQG